MYVYAGGYLVEEHVWEDAEDGSPSKRYTKTYAYEDGLLKTTTDFDGTVRTTTRAWESGWTSGYVEIDSIGSPGVTVAKRRYDFTKGTLDRPGLYDSSEIISTASGEYSRTTQYFYDWRNRMEAVVEPPDGAGKSIVRRTVYDHADRPIKVERFYDANGNRTYDSGTLDRRITGSESHYDLLGRVWRTIEYEGDTVGSQTAPPAERITQYTYDLAGGRIRVEGPSGLYEKTRYDALGRADREYVSYDEPLEDKNQAGYLEARSVSDDIVLFERRLTHDDSGNVVVETTLERHHDATAEGELSGSTNAIPQSTVRFHDPLGRLIYEDFRGNAEGETGIVREYEYSPLRGVLLEVSQTVSGSERRTRFAYDNLRRKVSETRSYDPETNGGEPSPSVHDRNQRVVFVYGAPNASRALDRDPYRVLERWAYDTPSEGESQELKVQKTRWVYGPPVGSEAGESEISSGDLLWKICYGPETK